MELRKQLSGFESSLLTCNRQAAVKIRSRILNLKLTLAECVADGIKARKIYSEENFLFNEEKEVEKKEVKITQNGDNAEVSDVEVEVEVDTSIVDRGSELLENILSNGRPIGTVEETWERIILAEKMRFRLDLLCGGRETKIEKKDEIIVNNNNNNNNSGRNNENAIKISNDEEDTKIKDADNCTSRKYVSYVNQNFNSVKRLPAVVKA